MELNVNGKVVSVDTPPDRPLLDVLREDLHLTGSKFGCGEGQCRACTVLLDGRAVPSCRLPVSRVGQQKVVTIEGLPQAGALHPVQEAFLAEEALQCGYCVPGMILTATALLEKNPNPTDQEIADGMNGNLCRCCGYIRIVAAIKRAARNGAAVSGA